MTPEEYKRYWSLIETAARALQSKFAERIQELEGPAPLGPLVLHREDEFRLRQSWQAYPGSPIHSIDIVLAAANLRRDQATERRWAIRFGSPEDAGEGVAVVLEEHSSDVGMLRKSQPNGTSYATTLDPKSLLKCIAGKDDHIELVSSDMADSNAFSRDPQVLLNSISHVHEDLIEGISKEMADQISAELETAWEDDIQQRRQRQC